MTKRTMKITIVFVFLLTLYAKPTLAQTFTPLETCEDALMAAVSSYNVTNFVGSECTRGGGSVRFEGDFDIAKSLLLIAQAADKQTGEDAACYVSVLDGANEVHFTLPFYIYFDDSVQWRSWRRTVAAACGDPTSLFNAN
jgi:hypothetical protein